MHSGSPRHPVALMLLGVCALSVFGGVVLASSPAGKTGGDGCSSVMSGLLEAAGSPEAASALELDHLTDSRAVPGSGSPLRPAYRFLLAEVYRLRGEEDAAYRCYTDLVASLSAHPARDGAGTSIATLSLLRSARMLTAAPGPEAQQVRDFIHLSSPLLYGQLLPGALQLPVLGGPARLEEALLIELAILARSIEEPEMCSHIFTKYLEVASTAEPHPDVPKIMNYLISRGMGSEGAFALLLGKRFYRLTEFEDARRFLAEAHSCAIAEIEAEAGYYLARTRSTQGASRKETINLLTSALEKTRDARLIQEILFYRATVFNREGAGRNIRRALQDLSQIIEGFPAGELADDALLETAKHHEAEGNTAEALSYLARLRTHAGPNDWLESSYFRAALVLYARYGPGDLEEAVWLLEDLNRVKPHGNFSLASHFWLGRMASERGDTVSARSHFERVIAISPYDYYAIRARMHLNRGAEATGYAMIDAETAAQLADGPRGGASGGQVPPDSSCGDLIREALRSGLLTAAASVETRLRDAFPAKHPSELTVDDLDATGTFAATGILLDLRQAAVEAAARCEDRRSRLSIAASVGQRAGDWPLAMLLVFGLDRSVETQAAIQHDPIYLATAYPAVYAGRIAGAAHANGVPPELLYAVIRRESLFHPSALSKRGALGLFQFIPSTFDALDKRWHLLAGSGAPCREAYLLDPGPAIELGARWFSEELLKRHEGNVLVAVMEHNAGYPAVKTWIDTWTDRGQLGDVEYMIESAAFSETRIFARSVLTDMAIAQAVGLFKREEVAPHR